MSKRLSIEELFERLLANCSNLKLRDDLRRLQKRVCLLQNALSVYKNKCIEYMGRILRLRKEVKTLEEEIDLLSILDNEENSNGEYEEIRVGVRNDEEEKEEE